MPEADDEFELAEPLKVGGAVRKVLVLREPTAAEMLRASRHIEHASNPEADMLFERDVVAAIVGVKRPEDLADVLSSDIQAVSGLVVDRVMAQLADFDPAAVEGELPLDPPVRLASGFEVGSIAVRPAKTGEMLRAKSHLRNSQGQASKLKYQMTLVAAVGGLDGKVVDELPVSAVMRAAMVVDFLSQAGRRTGSS